MMYTIGIMDYLRDIKSCKCEEIFNKLYKKYTQQRHSRQEKKWMRTTDFFYKNVAIKSFNYICQYFLYVECTEAVHLTARLVEFPRDIGAHGNRIWNPYGKFVQFCAAPL